MYGSQLIAVKSLDIDKYIPGVSESKDYAELLVAAESSPKPTPPTSIFPMSPKVIMPSTTVVSKTSKKWTKSKKAESGTSV